MDAAEDHAGWEKEVGECLRLAAQSLDEAFGPARGAWMERLEQRHAQFAYVLDGLAKREDAERGLELAFLLQELWFEGPHTTEGRDWFTRLLSLPAAGPDALRARALDLAGALALNQGDYSAAEHLKEEGLAILRQVGDPAAIGFSLLHLGHLYGLALGDFARGRATYREAYDLLLRAAHAEGIAHALANQANMCLLMQAYRPARDLTLESLRRYRDLDSTFDMAHSVFRTAGVLAGLGQPELALRLAGAATAQLEALGVSEPAIYQERFASMLEPARRALSAEAQTMAWSAGQSLSLAEAVDLALARLEKADFEEAQN